MPSSRKAELVGHPAALGVAGNDRRLHPVQAELLEPVADDQRDGVGRVAAAGVRLVDPVADERRLERAAQDAPEAHLADERAVAQEDPEAVGGVELALAVPGAAAGTEGLAVDDGIARARLGERLPRARASRGCGCGWRARRRDHRRRAAAACTRGPANDDSRRPLIRRRIFTSLRSCPRRPRRPTATGWCGSISR